MEQIHLTLELDNVILGTNPFVGISHFSSERGREGVMTMDRAKVASIATAALEAGADGISFSVSPLITEMLNDITCIGTDRTIGMYPIVPNTEIYATTLADKGIVGLAGETLGAMSMSGKGKAILQGGLSLLTADPQRAIKAYVNMEINRLVQLVPPTGRLRTLLLHELATDLGVALGARHLLKSYAEGVHESGLTPGFVTRNLPGFVRFCDDAGISLAESVVMTPWNSLGFQMTPTREQCEALVKSRTDLNIIAISILAAGRIELASAFSYIESFPAIRSVTVGVSSESQARETFSMISKKTLHHSR